MRCMKPVKGENLTGFATARGIGGTTILTPEDSTFPDLFTVFSSQQQSVITAFPLSAALPKALGQLLSQVIQKVF